jgi:hypothetical protein
MTYELRFMIGKQERGGGECQAEARIPATGPAGTIQYSIIPAFQPDANRAKRTQFPAGPGGMGHQGRGTRGQRAKRTQFSRRGGAAGARDAGQMCKTNPISGGAGRDGAAAACKAGQMCKTKPIRRRTGGTRRRWPRRQVSPPRTSMRNKPNFRRGNKRSKYFVEKELWQIDQQRGSTKQSQFACLSRRGGGTGPQRRGQRSRVAGANRAKQTQFPGRGAEPLVRNEPNSARPGLRRGKCAKRTQFGEKFEV